MSDVDRYMPHLNELYARFEEMDFKTRFQSIIHHPLNEMEFEAAWQMMLNDFQLHENNTLVRLYEIRKDWVPAFFKGDYCVLMVSTQRNESMNKLVKSAHVDANTPLHQFAKQMMKLLHSRKMKEAKEALGCMGQKDTTTLYMFEIRIARAYTRAVMTKFQETVKYATAYQIDHDTEGDVNDWVVKHTTRSNKIVWGQHQFKLRADVDAEKYSCECKHWEHTGTGESCGTSAGDDIQVEVYETEDLVIDNLRKLDDGNEEILMGSNTNECNANDDQCNMLILTLEHNTDMRLVDSGATDVEARKKLEFHMEGVNLARPDKANPKGRTIKSSEQQVLKLGAKGAKKMSKKCQKCGIADGHNSRTCLTVEDNRVRLANLSGRKREDGLLVQGTKA
eukprot:XP_020393718.1 uncharacterized protein LOC109939800 [Zea mays]